MKKPTGNASVRELKAAALDTLVKAELAKTQAARASKMSRLRELRLARDAAAVKDAKSDPLKRKPVQPRSRPARKSGVPFAPAVNESSDDGL